VSEIIFVCTSGIPWIQQKTESIVHIQNCLNWQSGYSGKGWDQKRKVYLITAKHIGFCGSFPKGLNQLVQQNLRPCPTACLLKRAIKTHCIHFPFCLTFQLPCQCVFTPGIFNHSHMVCAIISVQTVPKTLSHLFSCDGDSSFVSSNMPD